MTMGNVGNGLHEGAGWQRGFADRDERDRHI